MQLVFGVCAAGATILTVNANLLGGNIGFFQSMCLLGYSFFPLEIATTFAGQSLCTGGHRMLCNNESPLFTSSSQHARSGQTVYI